MVFAHTIFAMPFAFIGFFLAVQRDGYPLNWRILLLVIACMIFARNAAMGFNRWADRHFDQLNPRTAIREIPKGIISGQSALLFSLANAGLFILAAGLLNRLCLYLSPVALFVILGYSYTKRFTRWCHLILGLGLSLAPIGAYLAVAEQFNWLPLLFSAVVLFWVSGFDIIYALQDAGFDKDQKLKSVPAVYGLRTALLISTFLHFSTAILILIIGWYGPFGWLYWIGATLFILLLIYQHLLVSPTRLDRINRAFGTTNGIASLILALFVILDLYLNQVR